MDETVVLWFGNNVPSYRLLARFSPDTTFIISRRLQYAVNFTGRVEPLEDYISSGSNEEALNLLKRLNRLNDRQGRPYRSLIRYHGYEPWWFQQNGAFQYFLVPYTRYAPLLLRLDRASRVVVYNCPGEFKPLLILSLQGPRPSVEFIEPWKRVLKRPLQRLNSLAGDMFYKFVSLCAIVVAVLRRPQVLLYTVDVVSPAKSYDARIESLYFSLKEEGISFLEVTWSPDAFRAVKNLLRRKRPCLHIHIKGDQQWDKVKNQTITVTGPDERKPDLEGRFLENVALHVLVPRLIKSVRLINHLEFLLKLLRPRFAFFIDDHRHAYQLVVACKRLGIPTLAVQHGQFNRYTVGLMAYGFGAPSKHSFDRYCLWRFSSKQRPCHLNDSRSESQLFGRKVEGIRRQISRNHQKANTCTRA